MKKKLPLILVAGLGGLLSTQALTASPACCPTDGAAVKTAMVGEDHASLGLGKARFTEVIGHYLAVQDALANDDLATAKAAGAKLAQSEAANKVLQQVAQRLAAAGDISEAREAFLKLSNNIIAIARASEAAAGADLYLAHCPMAFGNKGGAWLQSGKPLANPYYGAMMLRCGTLEKLTDES